MKRSFIGYMLSGTWDKIKYIGKDFLWFIFTVLVLTIPFSFVGYLIDSIAPLSNDTNIVFMYSGFAAVGLFIVFLLCMTIIVPYVLIRDIIKWIKL
jgi:hypothetical protein